MRELCKQIINQKSQARRDSLVWVLLRAEEQGLLDADKATELWGCLMRNDLASVNGGMVEPSDSLKAVESELIAAGVLDAHVRDA